LCEVALSDVFKDLTPSEAAAVLTALVSEGSRAQDRMPSLSAAVSFSLEKIGKIARQVFRLQREFDIDISIDFNFAFSGITEMWANGASWSSIVKATTYAEGDVVRSLRRTLDLARQFTYAPNVPEHLVNLCHQVEMLIARDELKQEM
jgi:ATP-dependent RNA helicase DOB1